MIPKATSTSDSGGLDLGTFCMFPILRPSRRPPARPRAARSRPRGAAWPRRLRRASRVPSGRRAGSPRRTRASSGPKRLSLSMPRSAARDQRHAGADRDAGRTAVRPRLVLLAQPFRAARALREHRHHATLTAEAHCGRERFDVAFAASYGERPGRSDHPAERRPPGLVLRHEMEGPRPEGDAERPGVEVRGVVCGDDEPAVRRNMLAGPARAAGRAAPRPAATSRR